LTEPCALSHNTLPQLAAHVAVPAYDRSALVPSVVHISVGAFHRSHQAVYFDELAQRGISAEWGLVGVGLHRPEMREALAAQDGLYTVVSRSAVRDEARVIGVIGRYLYAPEDGPAVIAALADPRTRVVTLTITGYAYHVDPRTGAFDERDPGVAAELADPSGPSSALGFLVEGLARRRGAGLPGFTVLSCDNVPDNGAMTRTAVVSYARLRDERLAAWIEEHVTFPSSMVDRITPRTTPADRAWVEQAFGVSDRWPVITEPFSQWVVEDDFCNGRPPLERVGVRFVSDVRPYSLMKTRLLNATHCALGYLGSLAGLERMDEAMQDPVFAEYAGRLMREEIAPLLPPVDGIDLAAYRAALLLRFANPKIGDSLERLRRAGSAKVPRHVVSSLAEARAAGHPHALLTLAVAGWIRALRGTDDGGLPLAIDDPSGERLHDLAVRGGTDPRPLLAQRELFGGLADDAELAAECEAVLTTMERIGTRAAVASVLEAADGMLTA
jgi:mannitol 2-dehydrogenase